VSLLLSTLLVDVNAYSSTLVSTSTGFVEKFAPSVPQSALLFFVSASVSAASVLVSSDTAYSLGHSTKISTSVIGSFDGLVVQSIAVDPDLVSLTFDSVIPLLIQAQDVLATVLLETSTEVSFDYCLYSRLFSAVSVSSYMAGLIRYWLCLSTSLYPRRLLWILLTVGLCH